MSGRSTQHQNQYKRTSTKTDYRRKREEVAIQIRKEKVDEKIKAKRLQLAMAEEKIVDPAVLAKVRLLSLVSTRSSVM